MEKPYLNRKEIIELVGKGRALGDMVVKDLKDKAKAQNYYVPETKRQILIPTHLVKKELKISKIDWVMKMVNKKRKPHCKSFLNINYHKIT